MARVYRIASQDTAVDEKMASAKLTTFVERLIGEFLEQLRARIRLENSLDETAILVRALDRFHRRLQALSRLLTTVDFSRAGLDLVLEASELHCQRTLQNLKDCLQVRFSSVNRLLCDLLNLYSI